MNTAYWLLAATTAADVETAGEIMGGAGMTAIIGLVVVFAALLLLTLIFILFGKVVSSTGAKGASKAAQAKSEAKPAAPAPRTIAAPAPVVENGVSDEVVAVIAAALAAMAPAGKAYAVRRVSAARPAGRPTWAMAGLLDSTRPF